MKLYFLICTMLCSLILGTTKANDLFVEIKNDRNKLILGHYASGKTKRFIDQTIHFNEKNALDHQLHLNIQKDKKILIFIHAMWGNAKVAQKQNLKLLRKLSGEEYQIINIVWKAGHAAYKKNWYRAIETGEILAPVLEYIRNSTNLDCSIFCHSMGHRIFEGMYKSTKETLYFDHIIFAAADLDRDVFSKNLKPLLSRCETINVYFNKKDRLLKMSKGIHGRDRLGLNGISETTPNHERLKCIDVTRTKAKGSRGASRHLYYQKDRKVIADISMILRNELDKRNLVSLDDEEAVFRL